VSQTNRSIVLTFACLPGLLCLVCAAIDQLTENHFVPTEKKLPPAWVKGLYEKGGPRVYRGAELKPIGMPIGGIGAGQMYLGGDGRLLHWAVFNKHVNTGYGSRCYRFWQPEARVDQGFALRVVRRGRNAVRRLDAAGVGDVRFVGEWPIGVVEYRDPALGVDVTMSAFSPFIPLNAPDSGLPATILRFTLKNAGKEKVEATLAGWLENAVLFHSRQTAHVRRVNTERRDGGLLWVNCEAVPAPMPKATKPPEVFADFEGKDYGDWKVQGEAFGKAPARGTLPSQQAVSGFRGKGLVNTYLGKDGPQGVLTSPTFTIGRPFINFLIGGGDHKGRTCINLVVDKKIVRTAVGKKDEQLLWNAWSVEDLAGRKARIEIVDRASGPWGHINIDHIIFSDVPTAGETDVKDRADFGTMGIALLGPADGSQASASLAGGELPETLFGKDGSLSRRGASEAGPVRGAVARTIALGPGETAGADFVIAWHFPNHKHGHYYATRFRSAGDVARYVADNFQRLGGETQLWHDTYYDSTLPHWLLDRLHMPVSTLATNTVQWRANGRFWGWEGVGCCAGTCTHVWNYEHALARLQPHLERTVRIMQDFGEGFDEPTGLVGFRSNRAYAADGQCGTVLKAYREHLISPDNAFLKANYPKIRKAMEYMLGQDGDEDGLIAGSQHNTFDINFHGPNTFVGSLYLAALRAAEEMAKLMQDEKFAARCRKVFASGSEKTMDRLYDGEYFFQDVDLARHARAQYAHGCLADQLFGQNWAHQLSLGYLYPKEAVRKAIRAVYKYNWAPDVGPHNKVHRPERVFARPGEAGLFICTWPKSRHLERGGVRYRNEVWTGIEYQVAAGLIYEDCIDEGLTIIRAVHDRYDAKKRNPWNEVECGDHYARAMSCWGCLLALCGFEYDGPAGRIAMGPRITPDDFRCAFTAAEGWGTLAQKRAGGSQTNTISVRWGKLRLTEVDVQLPAALKPAEVQLRAAKEPVETAPPIRDGNRLRVRLARPIVLETDQQLILTARKK